MLCKCYWTVLYTVHVAVFCLEGPFSRSRCIYEVGRLMAGRYSIVSDIRYAVGLRAASLFNTVTVDWVLAVLPWRYLEVIKLLF